MRRFLSLIVRRIIAGSYEEDLGLASIQTNFVKLADLDDLSTTSCSVSWSALTHAVVPTDIGFETNEAEQKITSGMANAMINVEVRCSFHCFLQCEC